MAEHRVAVSELAHCYGAYGLRIRSAFALPFDPLSDTETADVTVRFDSVPRTLPDGAGRLVHTGMWQARPGVHVEARMTELGAAGTEGSAETGVARPREPPAPASSAQACFRGAL